MKKTVVIGASENPERFSNRVIRMLNSRKNPIVAIGLKEGEIDGIKIQTGFPKIENAGTVTIYVGPKNQIPYYDYLIGLKPERIIFNPGTENPKFEKKINNAGIEVLRACTLTMLTIGNY